MQTSLLAIAKKAQEKKDLRFFNLYRLIDENLLLDCWRDIRKNAAYGVDGIGAREYAEDLTGWGGRNRRAGVRRGPDRQHQEPCRAAEEEDVPGQTGSPSLDTQTGWKTASSGNTGGRR